MRKDLLTWFEEKFESQLKHSPTRTEAFYKACENAGFEPYSSYNSFQTLRSKKYKKKPKR